MPRPDRTVWVACWLLTAGCFQSLSNSSGLGQDQGGDCASCRHSSTGNGGSGGMTSRTSAGGSTGGGGTSATGTTVSGGGSGSSSGASSFGGVDAGPCNGFVLRSVASDALAAFGGAVQGIAGVTVSAIGLDGAPIGGEATVTAGSGAFALCVAPGQPFTTELQATAYEPTYLGDLVLTSNYSMTAVPLGASATIAAYTVVLPGFVPTGAVVIGDVFSASRQPPCNDMKGWVVSATLPDGGEVGYQTAYLDSTGLPHWSQPSTDPIVTDAGTIGIGLLYNIDPSVTGSVLVTATQPGGANCPVNEGGPFSGRVVVDPSSFSFVQLNVP